MGNRARKREERGDETEKHRGEYKVSVYDMELKTFMTFASIHSLIDSTILVRDGRC